MSLRIERIGTATEKSALAYLDISPYESAFLSYLMLFDASPSARNRMYVALDGDAVTGVAYFGRQTVLQCDDAAIAGFAHASLKHRGQRMIVGPRRTIEAYWPLVQGNLPKPRLVRERQFVMKIDRAALRPYELRVSVRKARMDEWTSVADNSAAMIAGELEYDPRRTSPEFTANVRAMIERGLWWVGEQYGRLCFYCNVGPWSMRTAQLQGIWVPPDMRGKGLATASLGAICDKLLGISPTLSLYVNDFNAPAISLYERVGFTHAGEFTTILF